LIKIASKPDHIDSYQIKSFQSRKSKTSKVPPVARSFLGLSGHRVYLQNGNVYKENDVPIGIRAY
jgi:hypothetical protein